MSLKRRQFLLFLGAAAGSTAAGSFGQRARGQVPASLEELRSTVLSTAQAKSFQPVKGPMPYDALKISPEQAASSLRSICPTRRYRAA